MCLLMLDVDTMKKADYRLCPQHSSSDFAYLHKKVDDGMKLGADLDGFPFSNQVPALQRRWPTRHGSLHNERIVRCSYLLSVRPFSVGLHAYAVGSPCCTCSTPTACPRCMFFWRASLRLRSLKPPWPVGTLSCSWRRARARASATSFQQASFYASGVSYLVCRTLSPRVLRQYVNINQVHTVYNSSAYQPPPPTSGPIFQARCFPQQAKCQC